MISIIVSTYKPDNFLHFEASVKDTIGDLDYEIIKIDNPGVMGICEAYNRGIERARYPYICFSHDDIIFKTNNWGSLLINSFVENEDVGLIGCAGASYKAWVPSGWSSPPPSALKKENLIQVKPDGSRLECISTNMTQKLEYVVSLDGCWLCTKKEITDRFKFDSDTFKSYHCYDIDYSLQVFTQYKVVVTKDILIEHFSGGSFSADWLKETYRLHEKWKELPLKSMEISNDIIKEQEVGAYYFLLGKTLEVNSCYKNLLKVLFDFKLLNLVGVMAWVLLFKQTIIGLVKALVTRRKK
ncbi:MAG: glycosyltransferase [Dysgonomonas sp.]|nr:glycosyltransferase [Dysgonomonas sp.]